MRNNYIRIRIRTREVCLHLQLLQLGWVGEGAKPSQPALQWPIYTCWAKLISNL